MSYIALKELLKIINAMNPGSDIQIITYTFMFLSGIIPTCCSLSIRNSSRVGDINARQSEVVNCVLENHIGVVLR